MPDVEVARGFSPDWSTHPGEHLEEHIEAHGWSQAEFARRAGLTPKVVSEILSAKNPVSPETAMKLERVLGLKAEVWLALQSHWDLFHARVRDMKMKPDVKAWASRFPIAELSKRGVLPAAPDDHALVDGLCRFFAIGEPSAYQKRLASMVVHHRQAKGDVSSEHIASWLMLGEWRARAMNLPAFDESTFLKSVSRIRELTTKEPSEFEPQMVELCRNAGVALVFEKPLSKTKLFGSARWLDGGRNAIIQLSLRMKFNDHFWWTFFHECGHIALHRGKNFADDQGGKGDGPEHEADRWAEEVLYGRDGAKEILESPPETIADLKRCAKDLRIHPGVLVGMLQHYGVVPFASPLNKLKAKFVWSDEPA